MFKINDRVRYTGCATFRVAFEGNRTAVRKLGCIATVVHGPLPLPVPNGDLVCYTIAFDDGEQWLARIGDLEPVTAE